MTTELIFNTFQTQSNEQVNRQEPLFTLPKMISNINSFAISSFSGTNTFYVIDSYKNKFLINEGASDIELTIPTGNYTYTTFLIELQLQLNTLGTDTYVITHDNLLNKYIITSTGTFKILSIENNCYFESGFVNSGANDNFESVKTAYETWQLGGIKNILISSSNFGFNRLNPNSNINVITSIPITQTYLGVIHFNPYPIYLAAQINDIASVNFLLLDERYRKFEVNSDWKLSILVNKSKKWFK